MKKLLEIARYFIDKLNQIRPKEIIVRIPPELKDQFEQKQLKNSIYRIKILSVVFGLTIFVNWPLYILRFEEVNQIYSIESLFLNDFSTLLFIVLFFVSTACFSKKGNHSILWVICYLFLLVNLSKMAYSVIIFSEITIILQNFFTTIFICTFVPDLKPKIFISFLILCFLTIVGVLIYENHTFALGGSHVFAFNIFLFALVMKILFYNSKVRIFINTFKINALNEKLTTLSTTDELTKLDNRRSFLEYMDIIWKQNHRLQLPITVIMIDIDYFKKYNDSLGHLEGDNALIAVAQCLKKHVQRETDFVARFGGEEFVCLLPYIEKTEAFNFAKGLVQSIENMEIPHPMSEHSKYVTISAGMASIVPNEYYSQKQLLDDADKALYMAKQSGRNRVVNN
jgi:diguanylate cyclase (GGDEF)-like protein